MSDIKERFHYDHAEDKVTLHREQDVEPVIKSVEKARELYTGSVDGLGHHVMRIPDIVIEQYMKEAGVSYHEFCNNPKHVLRLINDPDYAKFRVAQGRY